MSGSGCTAPDALLTGPAEACIPPFVAFAFLAAAWLLVVVGLCRRS